MLPRKLFDIRKMQKRSASYSRERLMLRSWLPVSFLSFYFILLFRTAPFCLPWNGGFNVKAWGISWWTAPLADTSTIAHSPKEETLARFRLKRERFRQHCLISTFLIINSPGEWMFLPATPWQRQSRLFPLLSCRTIHLRFNKRPPPYTATKHIPILDRPKRPIRKYFEMGQQQAHSFSD